jgi:NAD(P)H dehydrogenase (quinone)
MLAEALAAGAVKAGAHVRLHRVPELAPDTAIDANPQWRQHVDRTHDIAPEATMEDVVWADGYAFGSPTRFGLPSPRCLRRSARSGRSTNSELDTRRRRGGP